MSIYSALRWLREYLNGVHHPTSIPTDQDTLVTWLGQRREFDRFQVHKVQI